jgi:alpha-glucosidase
VLLLTLRGTPTLYYGEELGLADVDVPEHRLQDPQGLRLGARFSRDPCRTPMPWEASGNGGFTTGEPWLPLNPDIDRRNVELLRRDRESLLTLYRRLLALRRERPALAVGDYMPLAADGNVIAYQREHGAERLLVALNLGGRAAELPLEHRAGTILLGTRADRVGEHVATVLRLRGDEALVIELVGRG